MTYTGEHTALVAMEILGYWSNYPSLSGYQLYSMTIPDGSIEQAPSSLDPRDYSQTRPYGDAWVREGRSLALAVPSVVMPLSTNYLLNPAHPDFGLLTYESHGPFTFDSRIRDMLDLAKRHQNDPPGSSE